MYVLDPVLNGVEVTVSIGYDDIATSIVLASGEGAKLPDPASGNFNLPWYNSTDYKRPFDDPNVEIIRVTAKSTDTLTVVRPAVGNSYNGEGSTNTAKTHNTGGKTYKMILALTRRQVELIDTGLNARLPKTTNLTSIDDTGIADNEIAIFDLTNKKIKTSDKIFSTDGTLAGNSDLNIPTEKAVKTYADGKKTDNISVTSRILGRKAAGAGAIEELTLSEVLEFIGSAAAGDILYRGVSAWARLPKGTDGQVLTLASGLPSWAAAGGGTTLKAVYKSNSFSTTSGTYVDVTDLTIPIAANKNYIITFQTYANDSSAAAGMRIGLSLPTSYIGATGKTISSGSVSSQNNDTAEPLQLIYTGGGSGVYLYWVGMVKNGANAGNAKIQIMANTAGQTASLSTGGVLTVEEAQ